jgi:hypothetical protein
MNEKIRKEKPRTLDSIRKTKEKGNGGEGGTHTIQIIEFYE